MIKFRRNVVNFLANYSLLQNSLLDLLGGTDTSDLDIIKPNPTSNQPMTNNSNNQDLLDLLGGLDAPANLPAPNLGLIMENNNGSLPAFNANNQNSNFLAGDILNTNMLNGEWYRKGFLISFFFLKCRDGFTEKDVPIITAFDKDGLRLTFALEKIPDTNTITINVSALNSTLSNMTDFLFQAAVPKVSTRKLLMWKN